MSLTLVAPPLGVVIGYVMTSWIEDWVVSFLFQALFNGIAAALMILVPRRYLNLDEAIEEKKDFLEMK